MFLLRLSSNFSAALLALSCLTSCHALALNRTRSVDKRTVDQATFDHAVSQPFRRSIVAIGDLHGDYANTVAALEMAGVIKGDNLWTGNVDIVVQMGDMLDRGSQGFEIAALFEYIRRVAHAAGGTVITLYGNHEFMNLYGDWKNVSPEDIELHGGVTARLETLRSGWLGQALRENYLMSARIPLHAAIGPVNADYNPEDDASFSSLSHQALSFTHGGYKLGDSYSPYPSKVNQVARKIVRILQQGPAPEPSINSRGRPAFPEALTRSQHSLLTSKKGPLWYRGFATDDTDTVCGKIDKMLADYGVKRMIVGHTVVPNGIVSRCEGKILLIDTGISSAIGGTLSAVRFDYSLTPACTDSTKEKTVCKLMQKDVVTALYNTRPNEILVDDEVELYIPNLVQAI